MKVTAQLRHVRVQMNDAQQIAVKADGHGDIEFVRVKDMNFRGVHVMLERRHIDPGKFLLCCGRCLRLGSAGIEGEYGAVAPAYMDMTNLRLSVKHRQRLLGRLRIVERQRGGGICGDDMTEGRELCHGIIAEADFLVKDQGCRNHQQADASGQEHDADEFAPERHPVEHAYLHRLPPSRMMIASLSICELTVMPASAILSGLISNRMRPSSRTKPIMPPDRTKSGLSPMVRTGWTRSISARLPMLLA